MEVPTTNKQNGVNRHWIAKQHLSKEWFLHRASGRSGHAHQRTGSHCVCDACGQLMAATARSSWSVQTSDHSLRKRPLSFCQRIFHNPTWATCSKPHTICSMFSCETCSHCCKPDEDNPSLFSPALHWCRWCNSGCADLGSPWFPTQLHKKPMVSCVNLSWFSQNFHRALCKGLSGGQTHAWSEQCLVARARSRKSSKLLSWDGWSPPWHCKSATLTSPSLWIYQVKAVRFYVSPSPPPRFLLVASSAATICARLICKLFNGALHCQAHAAFSQSPTQGTMSGGFQSTSGRF